MSDLPLDVTRTQHQVLVYRVDPNEPKKPVEGQPWYSTRKMDVVLRLTPDQAHALMLGLRRALRR